MSEAKGRRNEASDEDVYALVYWGRGSAFVTGWGVTPFNASSVLLKNSSSLNPVLSVIKYSVVSKFLISFFSYT